MFLLSIFEIIGTAAFAVSGALVGIKKRLDFFGVAMLAITTALGGGIVRDIIIGSNPPLAFRYPKYCIIAIIAAIIVWFFYKNFFRLTNVVLIFDAIGLGAFTVNGARIAMESEFSSLFLAITLGVLTGAGGGVLRDLFVLEIPLVFRKEIYATAAIAGVLVYYYSRLLVDASIALYIGFAVTLLIRLVSMNLNLHLPVTQLPEEATEGSGKYLN